MINKKIMVLILLVSLLAVSGVSAASDSTNDAISADANNDFILQESGDENLILDNDPGEIQSNDSDTKTFTDLHNLINVEYAANDTIFLNDNYSYCGDDVEFKGGVVIDRALTIYGNGITLDGLHLAGIFNVTNSNVVLDNITFINGNAIYGGAVNGECTVANSRFINNTAQAFGGAIYLGNAYDCVFINNTAIRGGAIYLGNVYNCVFTENSAKSMGGGAMYGGAATNSIFIHNTATLNYGGAIYCSENNCLISNCSFINNTAGYGGAISSNGFSFRAYNCNFTNNRGTTNGGAIFWSNSKANIYNCNFINNGADNNGGAIYCSSRGNSSIDGCKFIINHALLKGGAVYCEGNDCQVSDCNFTGNDANQGGAIYRGSGNVDVGSCDFANNTAVNEGGAIFFANNGTVTSCNFRNNSAKNGGAIYFNGDINNVTVLGCFKGNNAERAGGAIYVKGKSMNNNFSSQFYDNNARNASGGAIFFYSLAENNSFEGIFMNNCALYGGGIFFYKKANNNKFDSNFTSNIAESCGGAIFFYNTTDNNNFTGYFTKNSALGKVSETVGNGGAITFKDVSTNCRFACEFINNTAALNGGGVNYRQTPHNITFNCNFINNNAPNGGGVNFFESFENVIFNGEFINNSAVNGGAIAAGAGSIKEVSFKNNRAENGGAVYFSSSSGTVENCNLTDNKASYGGAVYFSSSSGTVENCNLTDNKASYGGAVYINGDSCSISGCNFANNSAETDGGAVYCSSNNNTINHCNFTNNTAKNGGAIYFIYAGTVHDCYFKENTVERVERSKDDTGFGGAICFKSDGEVFNSTFYKNQANGDFGWYYDLEEIWVYSRGGAIYISGNGLVSNSKFYKNEANTGSAIFSGKSALEVSNSEFIANKGRYGGVFSLTFAFPDYMAVIFDCQNNYIDAIYKQPGKNITLSNVTYWNGEIVNTDYGYPIREFLGIPFNLSIRGCDGNIYYNVLYIPNGTNRMPYDLSLASYPNGDITIGVYHKEDDYFEEHNNTVTLDMSLYSRSDSSVSINTAESEFVYGNCYINFATENTCGYYIVITDEDGKIVYEKINKSSGINPSDDPLISPTYGGQDYNELIFVDLPAGCYNMTVYGLGSLTVRGGSDSKLFRIIPINSTINIDASEISLHLNDTVNLNATLDPADAGALTYASSNSNVVTVDADGNVHAVGVGKANVTVSLADGGHVAESKVVSVDVSLINLVWSYMSDDMGWQNLDGAVITAPRNNFPLTYNKLDNGEFLPEGYEITIRFNDSCTVESFICNGEGGFGVDLSGVNSGTYTVTFSAYRCTGAVATVTVPKVTTEIIIENAAVDLKVLDEVAVGATLTPAEAGNLTFTVSNSSVVKVENGKIVAVGAGDAIITVSFDGNVNYFAAEDKTIAVSSKKVDTVISAPDVSVAYKNTTGELVATIVDADGEPLSVDLNVAFIGDPYVVKADSNGQISIPIGVLTPGTYTATISFEGDDTYNASSTTADVIVTKADTVITARDITVDYGDENAKLVATLKNVYGNSLGVNVKVNLNGENYTVKANSKGQVFIPTASLTPGNYTATISYAGNVNYNPSSTTANITVNKAGTVISAPDVSVAYKNTTGELVATIVDADGEPLSVDLNVAFIGDPYAVKTDSNGQISIPIGVLSPGTYTATISFEGDDTYTSSSATADVVVTKADTVITARDITVDYGDENAKLVATLKNVYGNSLGVNVKVNLNGENYTVKANSKGQVLIPTASLAQGNYTATISYAGNVNYNPSSATANIVVNKVGTVISAPNVSVAYKNTTGELIATIVDVDGNALSVDLNVDFNGETYSVKADSNGQITIPIGVLTPGTYTATISYAGDDTYATSSATADVVVAKADTVISADDVCVTYKGDAGELVATIKNAYGSSLGVKLNVNFNGENYTIKADSRGKITLPIASSLTPGNYTATISYAGNVNYNPSSTTVNVVVDKADTVITAKDVTVKCDDEKGKLVATLKNEYGNGLGVNVNVNLNGQDYTIKAGSNGKIVVPTAGLASGSYVATISYNGNVNYNPSSTTANVIVKP